MLGYLLNVCYSLLLLVFSPYLLYVSLRKQKYREGWAEKLLGLSPRRQRNCRCIWLHAVSVGEVQLLESLIEEIERRDPDLECVISTTTKTGYALAGKKYPEHTVFYCPLDFTWAVNNALRRIRPDLLVLAELELWPNLILAARRRGVGLAVVNGRLSPKSFRGYRRVRWLTSRMLRCLDLLAVQNEEYAERFLDLGARGENLVITGSIKFDSAESDRRNPQTMQLASLAGFAANDTVFLAGSTQQPEESLAVDTFCALANDYPQLRLVLVPRHPDRFDEVAQMLRERQLGWCRRSQLTETAPCQPEARILLIDTVGELGKWWGTSQIGFVGGSLGTRGGQNMIEPAAYGVAVCFGPHTENFRDVVSALQSAAGAHVVANGAELTNFVHRCLQEDAYAQQLGVRAAALVGANRGATGRTVDQLLARLPAQTAAARPSTAA